jgi:triosephosphate isomerase (TIM)
MTPGVRPLVAGNWKMNGLKASLEEIKAMRRAVDAGEAGVAEVLVCPPATLLHSANCILQGGALALGAQDAHVKHSGAHTGDLSAVMLKDAGASYIIFGHSERRAAYGESDALVRLKAEAANDAALCAVICVGETREEREAGRAREVVVSQLQGSLPPDSTPADLVVAYEPVWAIGTGLTPTTADVAEMHAGIRDLLHRMYGEIGGKFRILYGGSVKPSNASELLGLANVDGALVGGASLKAADFLAIAATYA